MKHGLLGVLEEVERNKADMVVIGVAESLKAMAEEDDADLCTYGEHLNCGTCKTASAIDAHLSVIIQESMICVPSASGIRAL